MEVKTGDIMAELTGGCGFDGKFADTYSLFQVPEFLDGSGIRYSLDGKPYHYKWADYQDSFKLDEEKLPKGFIKCAVKPRLQAGEASHEQCLLQDLLF